MQRVLVVLAAGAALWAGSASAKPSPPCQVVAADSVRAQAFRRSAAYATEGFAMRRQAGSSTCRFTAAGEGACLLRRPGLVHVTTARTNAYFNIPRGRSAQIRVSKGVATCRTL
jgi:hypothetical protein